MNLPSLGPRGEGWVALQVGCFGLIAAAIAFAPPEADTDPASVGTRQLLGYMIGMVGAALLGSGISQLRGARALTAVPHPLPDAALAERGAYRLVRHPIYGGLILVSLGLAVITPWLGTFGGVALLAVVLDLKRRREELWLADKYPGYAAYRKRTKALIPFLY
jgi:protein-S-isoprenylcysteine O-methyltransferase Ste14